METVPWRGERPSNFRELFSFYHNYVKLLYSDIQSQAVLPIEVLHELNAAFDHLSRHWTLNESEASATAAVFSHLKRSCLDIFKLRVVEARREYEILDKLDTSILDGGRFDREL